jgi:hypothetical protein
MPSWVTEWAQAREVAEVKEALVTEPEERLRRLQRLAAGFVERPAKRVSSAF